MSQLQAIWAKNGISGDSQLDRYHKENPIKVKLITNNCRRRKNLPKKNKTKKDKNGKNKQTKNIVS